MSVGVAQPRHRSLPVVLSKEEKHNQSAKILLLNRNRTYANSTNSWRSSLTRRSALAKPLVEKASSLRDAKREGGSLRQAAKRLR